MSHRTRHAHDPGRRRVLRGAAALGLMAGLGRLAPAFGWGASGNVEAPKRSEGNLDIFELTIERRPMRIGRRLGNPITINGTVPGPLLRWKEGREVELRVTNRLDEDTSIHWHGILLPPEMDGVPGVSFPGIRPGETFVYRFPVKQYGTYWYHSHSGLQEQLGHYAPLIVEPLEPEPFQYDRDYAVVLSDWTFRDPHWVFSRLKKSEGYFNYQQRTVGDFLREAREKGWAQAWRDRAMWAVMRMSSRDILDVTGAEYTYLINGRPTETEWSALFRPGERVRLRFINAAAMTFFDVRIPGLKMTVVHADGQHVAPVTVDELRIGVAETYDVIVEPDDRPYTIMAEAMDRSGFVRASLTPRAGLKGPAVEPRKGPVERDAAAMGHAGHGGGHGGGHGSAAPAAKGKEDGGMGHGGMRHGVAGHGGAGPMPMKRDGQGGGKGHGMMHGMGHGAMAMGGAPAGWVLAGRKVQHPPGGHGPGAAMVTDNPQYRMDEPGVGLASAPGHRVLVYDDLRALAPWPDRRPPQREIELHLTGNMERYMWSFDGKKFTEVTGPIHFRHGERLRLIMVNDTMMDHPIHLHGMWMELENAQGEHRPRKHTVVLKPGEMLSVLITADAPGDWAFHCHLLYHMKAGMFRVVSVS